MGSVPRPSTPIIPPTSKPETATASPTSTVTATPSASPTMSPTSTSEPTPPLPPPPDDDDDDDAILPTATASPLPPAADVMIGQSASPDPATRGQTLTYTLTATNLGPNEATQATLTDTLPAAVTFVSASAGCSHTEGIVACDPGTLALDDAVQRTIVTTIDPAANDDFLVNQATISAAEFDPDPALTITDVSLAEGDSGATAFNFDVTLSAAGVETATVTYSTADGTATAPGDYITQSGTLTFPPGVTQQTITVQVVGDVSLEGDETFLVDLSNPTRATISDGQGVGTITNDD